MLPSNASFQLALGSFLVLSDFLGAYEELVLRRPQDEFSSALRA